jgi:SPP1 gp7 family putative phage head morphogenesis protein
MAIALGRVATALLYQRHGRKPPRAGVVRARPPTSRAFEREYAQRLRAIVRAWADHVETITRRELRADAFDDDMRAAWRALLEASGIQSWLGRKAREASGTNARYVERVANIPVSNVLPKDVLEEFLQDNLSLVTNMADRQVQTIADIIRPAQAGGERWEDVAEKLRARLGVTESRAKLIARDQANKFNSAMAEITQTSAGVEEYEWVTANDFAVRGRPGGEYEDSEDDHWRLRGKIFRWDAPPIINPTTGERGHPGQAIQCRCTARPVIRTFAQRPAPARPAEIVDQETGAGYPRSR